MNNIEWSISKLGNNADQYNIYDDSASGNGRWDATVNGKAYAILMASAPDLLRALQDAVETLEWVEGCTYPNTDEIRKAILDGRQAIHNAIEGFV